MQSDRNSGNCCVSELWTSCSQSSICYLPHWLSCGFTLSLAPGLSLPRSIERATQTQGNYGSQRGSGSADNTVVMLKNCFLFPPFKPRGEWGPWPAPRLPMLITFLIESNLVPFFLAKLKGAQFSCKQTKGIFPFFVNYHIALCVSQRPYKCVECISLTKHLQSRFVDISNPVLFTSMFAC